MKRVLWLIVCLVCLAMFLTYKLWKEKPTWKLEINEGEFAITFLDRDHLVLTSDGNSCLWNLKNDSISVIGWSNQFSLCEKKNWPLFNEKKIEYRNRTFCIDQLDCTYTYLYETRSTKSYQTFLSFDPISNPNFLFSFYFLTPNTTFVFTETTYRIIEGSAIQNAKNGV